MCLQYLSMTIYIGATTEYILYEELKKNKTFILLLLGSFINCFRIDLQVQHALGAAITKYPLYTELPGPKPRVKSEQHSSGCHCLFSIHCLAFPWHASGFTLISHLRGPTLVSRNTSNLPTEPKWSSSPFYSVHCLNRHVLLLPPQSPPPPH